MVWAVPGLRATFTASSDQHPDIVYGKVDTEAEQELAAAAEIRSIPTLMAFKKGKLIFNQAGALPPAALEDLIRQAAEFDVDAAIAQQGENAESPVARDSVQPCTVTLVSSFVDHPQPHVALVT